MRRLALTLASTAILALLVQAAPSQAADTGIGFGTAYCSPAFECPNSYTEAARALSMQDYVSIATGCVGAYLGMSSPNGLFEDSYGLDSSNCLTAKRVAKTGDGAAMTPKCCVKPTSDGKKCQLVCVKLAM